MTNGSGEIRGFGFAVEISGVRFVFGAVPALGIGAGVIFGTAFGFTGGTVASVGAFGATAVVPADTGA